MDEVNQDSEVYRLQRSMNDLLSLMALPAMWTGGNWSYVCGSLLDVLLEMLRLDFVYLILNEGDQPIDMARFAPSLGSGVQSAQLGKALSASLGEYASRWSSRGSISFGTRKFSVACASMGLQGEIGTIVAGSERPDFAGETERVLLGVAANQAALAIQQASLLDVQKRIASDLDQIVSERTVQLAQTNESLRQEVAERQRTEQTLRSNEHQLRDTLDNIPSLVLLLTPGGRIELTNREVQRFSGRTPEQLEAVGIRDLIHPGDLPETLARFERGLASGEPFDIVLRMRRHNGAHRWFEGTYRPLKDTAGRVVRWCVSLNDVDDRKQVEDALREAEFAWRSAINGIPALVATLSPEGAIEAVNQQIVDYTGYGLDELRRLGTNAMVHPDDHVPVAEVYGKLIAAGLPYEIELRLRRHDGSFRWFANRGTPARDAAGNIVRWYVLFVDIDEKREIQEALRHSEERARLIVDSIPAGIAIFEPTGEIAGANRQLLDYFGKPLEVVQQWGTNDLGHPEDLPHVKAAFWGMVHTGEAGSFATRLRRHDGEYRWFEVRNLPLRDASGTIIRWYGVLTDVDDRKHAEAALVAREKELRLTLDTIPAGIIVVEPTNGIVAANRQLLGYLGYGLDELKHWTATDMVHPDDFDATLAYFKSFMTLGRESHHETRIRRFDGVYRWFQVWNSPLRDADGQIIRWYGLLTDFDDRKRAEQALATSESELRLMLDTIPVGVKMMKPDGEVTAVSRQSMEYFGKTFEEFANEPISARVHPDDQARVSGKFEHSFTAKVPALFEYRARRADGHYRWGESRIVPVLDAEDHIVRWIATFMDIDDRKQAEEALRASEAQLRLIVDSIPGLVALFGRDGRAEEINQQFTEYLGQTVEEFSNWPRNGTVHPEDVRRHVDILSRSFELGQPIDTETRLRRFDGTYRWFQVRGLPAKAADGQIVRWYCLMSDIDDRKRAEEAVVASERNLQLTIDTIPGLAWSADPDGTADFFNRAFLEYVGLPLSELRRWGWVLTMHPDDRARFDAVWRGAAAAGSSEDFEARLRGADGSYRWFLFRAQALRDESGNIVKWYGIHTDIEDRKRAEEELQRSEASLAEAQRLSSIGSFTWLLESDEITFSAELYRIFEFDPNVPVSLEAIGTRVHPSDVPLLMEKVGLARIGITDHDYEIRLQMPDGRTKYLRTGSRADLGSDGARVFLGTIQDVTQQRVAEEALNELRTELAHVSRVSTLGAMTASIAHEVNQPLSGIITNASTSLRMLASEPPDIEGARETARRTIRDGNRAAEVVSRLRALFSKKSETVEAVDLNEAARDVLALATTELRRSRVELEVDLASGLPDIAGDRIQLQQVILNLLLNAADALNDVDDRPRRVVLRTQEDEDGNVRLTVRDTGIGIDPDNMKKLFEAFYTTKPSGMGIGLSISRSIIEHHLGRLWAETNAGPGATFSFAIPPATRGATIHPARTSPLNREEHGR